MNSQDVSVVVPVYNGQETIKQCIDSLLRSTDVPGRFEIIVVDNASTDMTSRILKQYGDRIQVLHETTPGSSAARNAGIRRARYDIIALTDSDCEVDAAWLKHLTAPLRDPGVGVVGGPILPMPNANDVELFGETIYDHEAAICKWQPPYAITANWAMNRRILEHVGGFDTVLLHTHDVDLAWRILQWGYILKYEPNAVVYHHNRETRWRLFRQGLNHGNWTVPVLKKHRKFLKEYDAQRFSFSLYRQIASDLRRLSDKSSRAAHLASLLFNSGKALGKLSGALRFRYAVL